MKKIIDKLLIALKIKKQFVWTPPEMEQKKHENASLKLFKPTIDCINKISKGGKFSLSLTFTTLDNETITENFEAIINSDGQPGIRFEITLPKMLNVGSVEYKESYGLTEQLILKGKETNFLIPEDSVIDFETKFPAKPQILKGIFDKVSADNQPPEKAFFRLLIPIKDKELVFPTSILEFHENHMKFDISSWDRQMTLMGIPFMTTMGMYSELTIKEHKFHFYTIEQISSQIIDSIDEISFDFYKKVTYSIRLCFAFLSGKFYKDESITIGSEKEDFSKVDFFEYQVEPPSIISENQIINPTFFFSQYSQKDEETQAAWKEYHKMFGTELFSSMCEKVIDSPEFMRSLELVVNAGSISDPVQKGALYSVSIETFTELFKSENEEIFKPIPKEKDKYWKQLRDESKNVLEQIKKEISDSGFSILNKKIENMNGPTNRDKLEKPFKLLGIELTPEETSILNQRNNYLHGGYPDDKEWIVMSNLNALKLHYLIGMLILKYLNYTGHYINVSSWFLLHNREAKKLIERFDFEELQEVTRRIQTQDFDSIEQLEKARKILEDFEKLNIAALTMVELIKII